MAHLPPARAAADAAHRLRITAWLWPDPALALHAVVAEAQRPGVVQRLASLPTAGVECLLPGALDPASQPAAPWLARLPRDAAFTDWLLFETSPAPPPRRWLALRSGAPLLSLRGHLRSLRDLLGLTGAAGGGERDAPNPIDPAVLAVLLPGFDRAGLAAFFGPVHSFVWPAGTGWAGFSRTAAGRLLPQVLAAPEAGT